MKTFDPASIARPYPFVGAVARGNPAVLAITVDAMVADAGNVTDAEASTVFGLGAAHIARIDSRSATDVSELAFRAHRGSVHAHKRSVAPEVSARWDAMAVKADAAGVVDLLQKVEADEGSIEMRRELLRHAAFFEGYKTDEAGQVRRACAARAGCMTHPAAAAYLASGVGDVAAIAVEVARPPERRKRSSAVAGAGSRSADAHSLRTAAAALMKTALADAGLDRDDSNADENALLAHPPASLSLVIAAVEAHVGARAGQ